MDSDYDIITVDEIRERLKAYNKGGDYFALDEAQADIIVLLKAKHGNDKETFLENVAEMWDDITVDTLQ